MKRDLALINSQLETPLDVGLQLHCDCSKCSDNRDFNERDLAVEVQNVKLCQEKKGLALINDRMASPLDLEWDLYCECSGCQLEREHKRKREDEEWSKRADDSKRHASEKLN